MKPILIVLFVLLVACSMNTLGQTSTTAKSVAPLVAEKGSPKSPAGFPSLPLTISYQGLLTTSGGAPVQDGNYDIQFDLFQTPTGGSSEWTETHASVAVVKGTFNVILGSVTSLNNFGFNRQLYLEVTATSGPSGPSYPVTFPRSALTSAPSSLAPWTVNSGSIHYDGGVGIGTASPGIFQLNVQTNGNFPLNMESSALETITQLNNMSGGGRPWWLVSGGAGGAFSGGKFGIFDANAFASRLTIDTDGNVGIGTTSPSSTLHVAGSATTDAYTKLGSDAPAIKMKKLTGTTAASQGGIVTIAHGLTDSKILSIDVMVDYSGGYFHAGFTNDPGIQFNWWNYAGSINVWNTSGNSVHILSSPIIILITYEE
jgi:hypothetical protein